MSAFFYDIVLNKITTSFLALFFLLSCDSNTPASATDDDSLYGYDWENHIPFETDYNTFSMPFTDDFESLPEEKGEVRMSEASGIAWSMKNPGMIWAHNDSGHANNLFLIDSTNGEIVARYTIGGTINLDWEDMELSYGPDEDEFYIYIADTGDNNERRPNYSIYRFPEPVYEEAHFGQTVILNDTEVDRIRFQYPDGSHDAEGMLVDPLTKDIFLVTKRDVVSMLYVLPYPQPVDELYTIYKAGNFSFRQASAATSSLSGNRVLIKNRQEIFYWTRNSGESMVEMLAGTPVKAPYAGEPQGEAICFDPNYNYFTLSEELNSSTIPPLFKYNFKN
jgi:hypothetical protein